MNDDRLRGQLGSMAKLLTDNNASQMQVMGKIMTITAALLALVETHPDPEVFAASFRKAWLRLDEPHSDAQLGPEILSGIDELLVLLEGACAARLNVRAPRQ